MEAILDMITLRTIVSVLLVLLSIWLLKLILKKQNEYIFRAAILFGFFFIIFIYLQQSEARKWTLSEIKNRVFPKKISHYKYHVEEGFKEGVKYTRYVFHGEAKPKLSLSLDEKGQSFHISDLSSLNSLLVSLNLPKLVSGVPELASITGSQFDRNHYLWQDYPPGVLLIERTLCRDKKSLQTYHCIATVTLTNRY